MYAILDTGASDHFIQDNLGLTTSPAYPITIFQSDGSSLQSTHSTMLPIESEQLPKESVSARIVPNFTTALASIGKFCDSGCTTVFTEKEALILKGERTTEWMSNIPTEDIIINGHRDNIDRLWHLPLKAQDQQHSIHSMRSFSTIAQRVSYYHACLGSPTISTWCHAIDSGHLTTFPLLTSAQVRKYTPESVAMHKGHLDQTQSNLRSTKQNRQKSHNLFIGVVDEMAADTTLHRQGTIYSDPTGRFITQSSQGNNYILVVFDGDSNYIFAEPIPSRSSEQILKAYTKIHDLLTSRGIYPKMHICDNEASKSLKRYLTSKGVDYQLVPPNQHRANAAERAIRTFKNNFIATLCSCDPDFPMHLWDRLVDQSVITLNLLRTSSINNRLSAYSQIHGAFDFNTTPIGPSGTKVLVHNKPNARGTWAPHGEDGWYIGPAMDHYRCFTVYIPSTRSTRISDTLAWFPKHVIMPTASSTDIAMAAAYDLTQALLNPAPTSALAPLSDSQRNSNNFWKCYIFRYQRRGKYSTC